MRKSSLLLPLLRSGVSHYGTFSQKDMLRAPLWRGKDRLSVEAQQTIDALKRATGNPWKIQRVFSSKVYRLIKIDMLGVLNELQQQNYVDIAYKVYEQARKEKWYKPSVPLHRDMLKVLARNGKVEEVHKLLQVIRKEKVELQMVMFMELIEIFVGASLFQDAMKVFEVMKVDCPPNTQIYKTMINSLNKNSQFDLSAGVEKELKEYTERTYGKGGVAPFPRVRKTKKSKSVYYSEF